MIETMVFRRGLDLRGAWPPTRPAPFVERVRQAWQEAGRTEKPGIVALTYFSLGWRRSRPPCGYL